MITDTIMQNESSNGQEIPPADEGSVQAQSNIMPSKLQIPLKTCTPPRPGHLGLYLRRPNPQFQSDLARHASRDVDCQQGRTRKEIAEACFASPSCLSYRCSIINDIRNCPGCHMQLTTLTSTNSPKQTQTPPCPNHHPQPGPGCANFPTFGIRRKLPLCILR